jgi:hypothetical protein
LQDDSLRTYPVHLHMSEQFTFTIPYKNENREFEAELRVFGYTHKIAISIDGTEILFEPDEERNYRAVLPGSDSTAKNMDTALLELLAVELGNIFK